VIGEVRIEVNLVNSVEHVDVTIVDGVEQIEVAIVTGTEQFTVSINEADPNAAALAALQDDVDALQETVAELQDEGIAAQIANDKYIPVINITGVSEFPIAVFPCFMVVRNANGTVEHIKNAIST
jgi:hypothetical protein